MNRSLPLYSDWEYFWDLHLTEEFRNSYTLAQQIALFPCRCMATLDDLREFFHELAGINGNARIAVSVNTTYINLFNHLAAYHGLPDPEFRAADRKHVGPVFDAIMSEAPDAVITVVRDALKRYATGN
jgi:hypothetical protein